MTLLVNVEPSTLTRNVDVILDALAGQPAHAQVVVEITERALAADLAGVLAGAERLRAAGCAIALDDREFEFVVSYDRVLVTAAAHALTNRLSPS